MILMELLNTLSLHHSNGQTLRRHMVFIFTQKVDGLGIGRTVRPERSSTMTTPFNSTAVKTAPSYNPAYGQYFNSWDWGNDNRKPKHKHKAIIAPKRLGPTTKLTVHIFAHHPYEKNVTEWNEGA